MRTFSNLIEDAVLARNGLSNFTGLVAFISRLKSKYPFQAITDDKDGLNDSIGGGRIVLSKLQLSPSRFGFDVHVHVMPFG